MSGRVARTRGASRSRVEGENSRGVGRPPGSVIGSGRIGTTHLPIQSAGAALGACDERRNLAVQSAPLPAIDKSPDIPIG